MTAPGTLRNRCRAATALLPLLSALWLPRMTGAGFDFSAEARERYEYYNNSQWGQGPQDDDGYLLQRYLVHGDWAAAGDAVAARVELQSSLENGRTGGPRATDEDQLDWHQAYLQVGRVTSGVALRAGRQELAYGSSRLISVRESPNVRLAFDAIRAMTTLGGWRVDAFGGRPVETDQGTFDDASDPGRALWGLYAVTALPRLPGASLDLYYLGYQRDRAVFDQGIGREERHSVGARGWGTHAAWDYNVEAVGQWGTFGPGRIEAWTVATDVGYAVKQWSGQPRFSLKANLSSGDRDPTTTGLQTFNALFPRGSYFSEAALIGPANLADLHPSVTWHPHRTVTLSADWDWFWRASVHDGVYGPSINLVRSGRGSQARTIGNQGTVTFTWQPAVRWTVTVVYAHFFTGRFLRETGPADGVDYASTTLTVRL